MSDFDVRASVVEIEFQDRKAISRTDVRVIVCGAFVIIKRFDDNTYEAYPESIIDKVIFTGAEGKR